MTKIRKALTHFFGPLLNVIKVSSGESAGGEAQPTWCCLLLEFYNWFQPPSVRAACFSVQLSATPWTVARQAPLSMGFSRQEYWSGLPFSSSRGSFRPRNQTLVSWGSCTAGRFLLLSHQGSPQAHLGFNKKVMLVTSCLRWYLLCVCRTVFLKMIALNFFDQQNSLGRLLGQSLENHCFFVF